MYDVALLKTGLIGATPLLSWRQNPDATGVQINDANLIATPTSGLYFNDFHPLLTPDNLFSIRPDFMLSQTGTTLNTSFSLWLRQKTEAAVINAIESWITAKFKDKTARNLLERDTLLKTATSDTKDVNNSKKVGREFVPKRRRGIKMTIEEISVQMDTNCTITIRYYHQGALIDSKIVTYTGNGLPQWETVNWVMGENASNLIFYDQTDNPSVRSINGVIDYVASGGQCHSCAKFFSSTEFETSSITPPLSYTGGTNHGLNFKVNVECDYTTFILSQKKLFKKLIGLQVAMDMLREMVYNPNVRVNRNASNVCEQQKLILYEIDGDSQGRAGGLLKQFNDTMNTLKFDETGIDSVCLNCKRIGPRKTSV